ncbi:MAG: hypothetical protein HYT22_04025 [Candidatus Niyogibacteria bacterium]|nr:hypothetical protein [Candidatus Niyogibacteria bacterium]
MNIKPTIKEIEGRLKNLPKIWDGRQAILDMKKAKYPHWKQMEWMGWYFQFLCERLFDGIMEMPGPQYNNVGFDGFLHIPWDFKAHAMNTSLHQIIVNDSEAIAQAIKEYDCVGVILALGKVEYNDEKRTFQKWHDKLKGEESKYVKERKARGAWSRLRKVSFSLQQISFIKIVDETLVRSGSFQEDFRNSGGTPRRSKVLIDLENIGEDLVHTMEF